MYRDHEQTLAAQVMDVKVLEAAKAESVLRTATFAGGCFWGLELAFQRAKGVVSTKVRRNRCLLAFLAPYRRVRGEVHGGGVG